MNELLVKLLENLIAKKYYTNKEEIENMDLPESEDIRIKILKKYQERILSI